MNTRPIQPIDILRYYVCYIDIEKQILEDLKSKDMQKRDSALRKYMNNHMKIGRNFKEGKRMIAYEVTENFNMANERNANELSRIFFEAGFLNGKIKNAKVAASKLLWLYNKSVVIMDNVNLRVLGLKTDDYIAFEEKWFKEFFSKVNEINSVINQYNLDKLDSVIQEDWFKMRVFDQYLWSLG